MYLTEGHRRLMNILLLKINVAVSMTLTCNIKTHYKCDSTCIS